jgi:hypothetical protein
MKTHNGISETELCMSMEWLPLWRLIARAEAHGLAGLPASAGNRCVLHLSVADPRYAVSMFGEGGSMAAITGAGTIALPAA